MITNYVDSQNRILEVTVSGKVSREELIKTIEAFKAPMQDWQEIRILKRIDSFEGMEVMAIIDDLKFAYENWNHYKKIKKVALVTDKKWAVKVAELFKGLFPGEIRSFENEDIEKARIWLK